MVSIPSVPVPISPGTSSQASEPTLSSSTVTLSWNAVSGATSYEVAVRDLNTNQLVVDQTVSGTSYQASLSPGHSYRWNVDAIDSAGASSFSSPLYFLTQASVSIPAVPVPISPGTSSQASEPTLSSSTVTLSWNAVSGATSYEVAVRDVNTNQLVVDQTVSGTSYQASLSPGGSYRWNVDAIDSAGASSFSSPLYFLTQASVSIPAVPVPISPGTSSQASEPTLSSSTVTLSWNAVSGATSYEVAVRDANTNQLVVDQTVSGTSYQASLSPGGSYRWNVDAIDSAGASSFSSPLYFLTQASVSIPAVPVPISPGTSSQASEPTLSSSTVTLTWNAVSGATSYEVAVRDVNTNQLVVDQTVSGTSYQASLSPGHSYRWNVDAIDSAGASSFSSPLYLLTPGSGGGGSGGGQALSVYPISGLSTIVQGNRSDHVNDSVNDHVQGTPVQWAFDFAVAAGTAVQSVANGTVVYVNTSLTGSSFTGYGNVITIKSIDGSGNPYFTTYAHLQAGSAEVSAGSTVTAGQEIAKSGSSGAPGAAHVHIQFGTATYAPNLDTTDHSTPTGTTPTIVADGSQDSIAPAYFPSLTIHFDIPINATDKIYNGTQGQDIFVANNLGDTVEGFGGNDSFTGGTGIDTAIFRGPRSEYSIVSITDSSGNLQTTVTDQSASGDGTDTLANFEKLQFTDQTINVPAPGSNSLSGIDYRVASETGTALNGVDVAALKSDHYQFVGEYIGNASNSGYLTQTDAQTLGLPIVSIYERSPDHIGYFTTAQADLDASGSASAITAAENVAHQPLGTAIYFTVDPAAESGVYSGFGALSSAYISAIETYFQRISADFAAAGNPYRIGIYGPGDVLTAIKSLNLSNINYYWVDTHWGTTFSGANVQRDSNGVSASPTPIGVSVDTDTALTVDFGQWNATTSGVSFSVLPQTGAEGSALTFRISIQNPNYAVTPDYLIYYNTSDGTAAAGSDYTGIPNQVAVHFTSASAQFIDVTVQSLSDSNPNEGPETFNFNIYDYQHTLLTQVQGTITDTAINHPPVVNIPNASVAATAGQSFSTSSLFTVTDADNDSLTYFLDDASTAAGSGHFVVNGQAMTNGTVFALNAAQLAQTTFVAGTSGASDNLLVMAYDGHDYSGNTSFNHLSVNVPVNHPPVVNIPNANVAATAGQTFAASSLFTVTDVDNDSLTYFLDDASTAAGSGHFVVNGQAKPNGTVFALNAAQLAQTTFVAGTSGASDDLLVMAYDGHTYSGNTSFNELHVNVPATNHPPVVNIPSANVAATAGQSFSTSSLFTVTDADNDSLTYFLDDASTAAGSGHFVVNGQAMTNGTVFALNAAQLAQTTFVAGTSGASDNLLVMAYDGHDYSGNTSFNHLSVNVPVNHPPVVNIPNASVAATAGQSFSTSSLFTVTDADNDSLTYFLDDASTAAGSGHFVVNGQAMTNGTVFALNAAQLAQTTFVAGTSGASDNLLVMAYDGHDYSGNTSFNHLSVNVPVNHPPVVNIPNANVAATAGQTFAASSLFTVTDVDNDSLTYFLDDASTAAGSGHFVVNGQAKPNGTVFALNAAQLAQTTFVAGTSGASDDLLVMAYDGHTYSGNTSFNELHVNVPATNHPPVVNIPSANVAATAGQSFSTSSLFTVTDVDNDSLTYFLDDASTAAGSGHFVVNGQAMTNGTVFALNAAQLAQTTFVAGTSGASDNLLVMAYDGHDYSGNTSFNHLSVNVPVNHPPVVNIPNASVAATAGQSFSTSSLFTVTDADNDSLTYFLDDASTAAGSGHFVVNGQAMTNGTVFALNAAQLAQTTFVAGTSGASDNLLVMAYDGHDYSGNTSFNHLSVNVPVNHPPVVNIPNANVAATAGQTFAASSLFGATDLDGDTLTYFLYDNSPAANSGHFAVNGSTVTAQTVVALSAAQIAQTTFVSGAAGSSDDLEVMVYDGHDYSGNTSFSHFHVVV